MKLHSNNYDVEKSADFEENSFSIEASAKAFMILSDGLYSNKILAVVRELSTNAYDSHVDAGCVDTPFEVHLPTRIEPFFHVRDFGTSMTHEQCMTLYTTYFRSTRNNSNDAVGCLGLGSKAPFAYSDNFTVEAFLNGEKRIYSAYRNSSGNPSFALLETVTTDEPNGIKVSMPVKVDDIFTFSKEAVKVFEHFHVRPNTNFPIAYNEEKPIIESEDGKWKFYKNLSNNFVVMGQIAYKLDCFNVTDDIDSPVYNFLYHTDGLKIFVNIGDVDITPSRESLSYTKQTKENIINIIKDVMRDIKESVESSIKNEPTLFLARKKYVEIENQCSSIQTVMKSLDESIIWNDTQLFDSSIACDFALENELTYLYKSSYRKKISMEKVKKLSMRNDSIEFYVDDVKRGGITRIKKHIKDDYGSKTIYVYKLKDNEDVNTCGLLTMLGGATIQDVKLTSNLPKVTYNKTSYGDASNGEIEFYNQHENCMDSCNFSVKFEDAVYLPTKKDEVIINGEKISKYSLQKFLSKLYDHSSFTEMFCFISPSMISTRKLEGRDNWKGPQYLVKLVRQMAEDYKESMLEKLHTHNISHGHLHDVFMMTKTDNKLKSIVEEYREYEKEYDINYDEVDEVWSMCNLFGIETPRKSEHFDENERFSTPLHEELKKYPLIESGMIRNSYSPRERQLVADYIDMIENNSLTNTYA